MTYVPTTEDIAFLAQHQPDKFTNPVQTMRSFRNGDPIAAEITARTHYNGSLSNGGAALTKSPIPAEPDADGDGVIARECGSVKPCCVVSGSVEDATDGSRKLISPPEGRPTEMLTVANDVEGANLVSKVKVKWDGKTCKVGHPQCPAIDATRLTDERRPGQADRHQRSCLGYHTQQSVEVRAEKVRVEGKVRQSGP